MRLARFCRLAALFALATAALGAPARPVAAAPAPWEKDVDDLASADPRVRAEAATRLGAAWPEGTLAALVLVEVAAEDADPSVRRTAATAIESLGSRALPLWARLLEAAKGDEPVVFHEWGEQLAQRGVKGGTAEFAEALHYVIEDAPSDEGQAAVLTTVALLVAAGDVTRRPSLIAFDLVLADRVRSGGPKAKETAAAGLALLANAALRDRGTHPSGAQIPASPAQASLFPLLVHTTPHVAVSACGVLGALGGTAPEVVTALTPGSATPDRATAARLTALARMGPAARTAIPLIRLIARAEPAPALAALVKLGERTRLLPEEPETVLATVEQFPDKALPEERVRELERFIAAARELALVDAALAEPARSALWGLLLRRAAPDYHVSNKAYDALERLGPLDPAADRQLGAGGNAKGPQPAIRLRMLAGSDPLGLLDAALDPVNKLAAHDVEFWLPVGKRIGAQGTVPAATLARKDLPESLRLGLLRGYAWASTPDPTRAAQALEALRDGEREAQALGSGQFVKQVAGAGRPAPHGEVARDPLLRAEMRVVAAEVLRTQAAAGAIPVLGALRADPDPRVRWIARRTLGPGGAEPGAAPARPETVLPPLAAVPAPTRPAGPAAAWEKGVADLASDDEKVRAEAAKRLGAAWPEGAHALPVLVEVSAMDEDAGVRTAAVAAIEALGGKALRVWATRLKAAATSGTPKEFHEVAMELAMLGPKADTESLCAALDYTIEKGTPDAQAGVLLAFPLRLALRDDGTTARLGSDHMLLERMRLGGPKVAEVAAAGMALLANVALRDRLTHQPGATGVDAAAQASLLALMQDERAWVSTIAAVVLGGLGAATRESVSALAAKAAPRPPEGRLASLLGPPETAELTALGRLGPKALVAATTIAELAKRDVPGAAEALARLGERKGLFPDGEAVTARLAAARSDPDDREASAALRQYAVVARRLARLDVSLAEPTRPALWAMVRSGGGSWAGLALQALREMGPLAPADERWLVAEADAGSLGSFATGLLIATGTSDYAARLLPLIDAKSESRLDAQFDEWWLAVGLGAGARGVVPAAVLARKDVSEAFRIGVLRGYAAAAPHPGRLQQAVAVLADTAKEAEVLAGGGIAKAIVGTFEMPEWPEIRPTVARRLEMRVRAVDVIGAQGPGAKAAVPVLGALLTDPNPRVRWRAHRALNELR